VGHLMFSSCEPLWHSPHENPQCEGCVHFMIFFLWNDERKLRSINVIILQFSEGNNGCLFYFVIFFLCMSKFISPSWLILIIVRTKELWLYIYNKCMNIFSRTVSIEGDVGVTFPKKCVMLNNYLLLNEKYYLSDSVYIYFIIFPYFLVFFLKYIH